jgi:hypothetical protein
MKNIFGIFFIALCTSACCAADGKPTLMEDSVPDSCGYRYANAGGDVCIRQINDTLYQTTFTNNEGFVFDTVLVCQPVTSQLWFMTRGGNKAKYLRFGWGGLLFDETKVQAHEFSSWARLNSYTENPNAYDPFYRVGKEVTVKGDLMRMKGGYLLDGIYLLNCDASDGYRHVTGVIEKEKFPRAYYSTSDGPQGMFGDDTTEIHYRLVMREYKIVEPEKYLYRGSTYNDSEGRPGIAWEYADSEGYLIWGKDEPWTKDELNKVVEVNAVLVQDQTGSWLKNAEISEFK